MRAIDCSQRFHFDLIEKVGADEQTGDVGGVAFELPLSRWLLARPHTHQLRDRLTQQLRVRWVTLVSLATRAPQKVRRHAFRVGRLLRLRRRDRCGDRVVIVVVSVPPLGLWLGLLCSYLNRRVDEEAPQLVIAGDKALLPVLPRELKRGRDRVGSGCGGGVGSAGTDDRRWEP